MIKELFAVEDVLELILIILFLLLLWAMNHLPKKRFSFAQRVLIGTGAGTVLGLLIFVFFGEAGFSTPDEAVGIYRWFTASADIYLGLFRMLIGPVIFISTAHLVIHTPAYKTTPRNVSVKKHINTAMVVLSASVGIFFAVIFNVGSFEGGFGSIVSGGGSIPDIAESLMPVNTAFDMLLGKVVAVFIAGGLVGIAARRMSGKYMDTIKPMLDLTDAAFSTFESVAKTVIAWKPVGAFGIMTALTSIYGFSAVIVIIKFIAVLTMAVLCMLVCQLLLSAIFGVGPAAFLRAGREAMIKALKTRSGSACLPEAQRALSEYLHLNKDITDEVSGYAIASGMQGCGALFPAMALIFTVNMAGESITPGLIIMALIVIAVTSYGITGAPGTATMAEFAAVMGTGMEGSIFGLSAMIAIDPIGDVPRTLINVTGCMTNAIIAERRLRE